MIYKTESGSVYQVDAKGKRVRRLTGVKEPTPRQGQDGEWKTFYDMRTDLFPGRLFFIWNNLGQGTHTSLIVETVEEN